LWLGFEDWDWRLIFRIGTAPFLRNSQWEVAFEKGPILPGGTNFSIPFMFGRQVVL